MEFVEKLAEIIDSNARSLWSIGLRNLQLKVYEELQVPEIGDLVVEITTAELGCPAINRLGYLRAIEKMEDGYTHYLLEKLTGETVTWANCEFIKVLTEHKRF